VRARELAHGYRKPLLMVNLGAPDALKHATLWLRVQRGRYPAGLTLGVGGPRESETPGIYTAAAAFLRAFLD
jgi:hypothetical protein